MTSSAAGLASTGTQLYYTKHGGIAFKKVANVKTTPEIGATPQQIEITNLGDLNQRYDLGMGSIPVLTFAVIYKGPDWNQIYDKAGNHTDYDWKLVYPDGMYITFTGTFDIQLQAMDINTAAMYNLSVAPTDVPRFHKSASDDSAESENGGGEAMSYRPMFVKTFSTTTEMNAYDPASEELIQGDFVLLNGDDADRGKVYFYNGSGFTFFANIIGPQGIQGDKGDPGLSMRMLGTKASLPAIADEGSFCFVGTTLYSYTNGQWINLGDFQGDKGETGDSAYTQAVQEGFKGTEQEWLASLKGDKGDSAYTQAVANGYTGIEADWIKSLKGDKGDSAYTQAVANGFSGTEADWIKSLKGDKGDPGEVTLADLNAGLGTKVSTTDADNKYLSKTDANKTFKTQSDAQTAHEVLSAPNLIDIATDGNVLADGKTIYTVPVTKGLNYNIGFISVGSSQAEAMALYLKFPADTKEASPTGSITTSTQDQSISKSWVATATGTIQIRVVSSNSDVYYKNLVVTQSKSVISYAQAQFNRHGNAIDKTQDLVGTRNLLINTENSSNRNRVMILGSSESQSGGLSYPGDGWTMQSQTSNQENYYRFNSPSDTTMYYKPGQTYTIIGIAKANQSISLVLIPQVSINGPSGWTDYGADQWVSLGTSEQPFIFHFTVPTNAVNFFVGIQGYAAGYTYENSAYLPIGASWGFKKIALYEGDYHPGWNPAPEDKVTDNHDGSVTVNGAKLVIMQAADVQKLIDTAIATATTTLEKYTDDAKQGAIDQIQPMITAEFTKRNAPSSWWNGDATAYAAITPKVADAEYDVTES